MHSHQLYVIIHCYLYHILLQILRTALRISKLVRMNWEQVKTSIPPLPADSYLLTLRGLSANVTAVATVAGSQMIAEGFICCCCCC